MKTKDVSVVLALVTGALGVAGIFQSPDLMTGVFSYDVFILLGSLIFVGYALASLSRSNGNEKAKQVCLYISSFMFLLQIIFRVSALDFVMWSVLLVVDYIIRNRTEVTQ